MNQHALKLKLIAWSAILFCLQGLAAPVLKGKYTAALPDEEITLSVKDGGLVFNGAELSFGKEKILGVESGGYKDFFSGENRYYCNATTAYAGKDPSGDLVIVVMDRALESKSYGYLCKLSLSPSEFNDPSSFMHYLVKMKNGKLQVTKTTVLGNSEFPRFKQKDILTTRLGKNKELAKYIQSELGDDSDSLTLSVIEPRAARTSSNMSKYKEAPAKKTKDLTVPAGPAQLHGDELDESFLPAD